MRNIVIMILLFSALKTSAQTDLDYEMEVEDNNVRCYIEIMMQDSISFFNTLQDTNFVKKNKIEYIQSDFKYGLWDSFFNNYYKCFKSSFYFEEPTIGIIQSHPGNKLNIFRLYIVRANSCNGRLELKYYFGLGKWQLRSISFDPESEEER